MFLESADGTGVLEHFHDTELSVACDFNEVELGLWRCLPVAPDAAYTHEIVYTDAACAEPHAVLDSTSIEPCATPRYVVQFGGCASAPRVFEIGPETPTDTRYRIVDGSCSLSTMGTDYLGSLHAVTEVSIERFQAARTHAGQESGGAAPVELRSDDGTRMPRGFRDAEEDFACHLAELDDGWRCVPSESGVLGYLYADAGCAEPAAMLPGCSSERRELAFAQNLSFGMQGWFRGGPVLPTSYRGSVGDCQPSGEIAFEVGEAVPTSRFVAGQRVPVGEGSVVTTADTVGSASVPSRTLRSTAHGGHECYAAHGTDGELRCMPPPKAFLQGFFADPECRQPVESGGTDVLAVEVPGVCPIQVRSYEFGGRYQGPVYAVTDGRCEFVADSPPDDSPRAPTYVYPIELSPAEFAPLSRVPR